MEKKNPQPKVVKMKVAEPKTAAKAAKPEEPAAQKLTYEQLEQIATRLSYQNRQMQEKLQKLSVDNSFKILDLLMQIVRNSEMFSDDFVVKCTDEIEKSVDNMITEPEAPAEKNPEK